MFFKTLLFVENSYQAFIKPTIVSCCLFWRVLFQFLMRFVNVHHVLLIHVRLRSRNNLLRSIALYSIVHGKYYSPLGRNLRFCWRRFGWQLQDFLLVFVSLNDDCFHNFCMNNIPVAQLQIALVDELLSLREGFVTFDCGNFLSKSDIIFLLNAACIEWWRRVTYFYWTILT